MFKRKKWKYLILDEAHMIKNWKSQRWQTLLNFNSKRRLLITGALRLDSRSADLRTVAQLHTVLPCPAKFDATDAAQGRRFRTT